jgi:hypothetical protein
MDRRDPDRHRAQVLPFRHPSAGGLVESAAVILSISDAGGRRVSKVRRGDGSTFTVTVPPGGVDTHQGGSQRAAPWIREDRGGRRLPDAPLDGLAARVGLHLTPGSSPEPPER